MLADHARTAHIDDTLETAIDSAGLAKYARAQPTSTNLRHTPDVHKQSYSAYLLMTISSAVGVAVCAIAVYYYIFVFG